MQRDIHKKLKSFRPKCANGGALMMNCRMIKERAFFLVAFIFLPIREATPENVPSDIYIQRMFRSACAFALSDQTARMSR